MQVVENRRLQKPGQTREVKTERSSQNFKPWDLVHPTIEFLSIFKVSCGVGPFLEDPDSQSRFFSRPLMDWKKRVHAFRSSSFKCFLNVLSNEPRWLRALVPGTETTELSLCQNSSELLYQFDHLASFTSHAFSSQEAEWQCLGGKCRINFAEAEAEKDKLRQPSC